MFLRGGHNFLTANGVPHFLIYNLKHAINFSWIHNLNALGVRA
jgi:hypothetical protein